MEAFRQSFVTRQPGKALFVLLALAINAVRLPFWLLYFLPRHLRQHPNWTFRQSIMVRIIRAYLYNTSIAEASTSLSLKPGKEGARFVTISPAQSKYYTGVATCDSHIRPERIGGTWYPAALSSGETSGHVVLHFHGGAYVIGDGRTQEAGFAAKTMIANSSASHVFCPQYRLSSHPGGRFPAALQDAITSYSYLVSTLGIPASKVVISGDSAGGNLALALMRYFADNGTQTDLSSAGCAWLWSPWAAPMLAIDPRAMDNNPNHPTDYLSGGFGAWGARAFAPSVESGIDISHPIIHLLGNAFRTETPMWISTGECEILMSDDIKLAEQMKNVEGNKVGLSIE